ncbi:MAG: tRNA (guanosine(46)-N7)-methyltransferase TrmB [Candidatus Egerieousia sp.]|nr:tRNA (guanosine(46)-N7)-methyltransferase TrmB [Candidatus Egerieousia sp.]
MSTKNKLYKFKENETFAALLQPTTEELLGKDYKFKGRWGRLFFGNDNPIVLELGCGKGEYTVQLAKLSPQKNFIGIDIKGARLWKGAKSVTEEKIPNAAFIRTRIEFIESLFGEGEISEIWITFADPQIKRARKRLTGTLFLKRYSHFLKPNGIVHLKTDSLFLYKYTLFTAEQNRLQIINSIQDLYGAAASNAAAAAANGAAGVGENLPEGLTTIRTFYEQYYIKNGFTIKYLSFRLLAEGNAASACEGAAPLSLAEPEWDEEYWRAEEAKGRENLVTNKGV